MTQIQTVGAELKTRKGKRVLNLHIDMTPMVDLGFLLISFFIFTAALTEKKGMDLIMPKEGPPMEIKQSNALTFLLAEDDRAYVYEGGWNDALRQGQIFKSDYNIAKGLGQAIREKQNKLGAGRDEMFLTVKPLDGASYGNLINALDETIINGVKKYAVTKPTAQEIAFLEKPVR